MKELFKNLATQTGRFRLRNEVPSSRGDGLIDSGKEGTGGLKLVTVFIAVLALHVLVIGSISAYHFFRGGPKETVAANGPDAVGTVPDATPPADKPTEPVLADADSKDKPTTPAIDTDAAAAPVPNTPAPVVSAPVIAQTPPATPAPAKVPVPAAPALKPTALAATAPVPAVPAAIYVVKKGDTLHRIAQSHGLTVAQLRAESGIKGNVIHIGQKLTLHGGTAPTVLASSTASTATPVSAPAIIPTGKSYKVLKGDTLVHIAKSFNTSPAAIMAANKLSDPRKLKIGAVLVIPGKSGSTAHVVTPVAPAHGQSSLALNQ